VSDPARRIATYQDVLDAPPHVVAEVISAAASAIGEELGPPFKRGRGGPGGWWILDEPELHLDLDVVVPDLAGWRRERLPELPQTAFIELPPDWACEVASPSTRRLDRGEKLRVYAQYNVRQVWLVEPLDQLLEVLELDRGSYRIIRTATGEHPVRLEPFEAIEFELAAVWAR
jgi:Uma2 family endonuclease